MKKIAIFLFLVLTLTVSTSFAHAQNLPQNYKEFKERCQVQATTPEGAVKMYFDAVFSFINPDTRSEGIKMLRYIMYASKNWDRNGAYSTFVSRMKDPNYRYVFRSFAVGTSPENNYSMDPNNYSIMIKSKKHESDYLLVALVSTGADSTRNIWLQQHGNLWYVTNNAGTYSSIRPPVAPQNGHDADFD